MTVGELDAAVREHFRTFYATSYGVEIMQTMRTTAFDIPTKTVVFRFPVREPMLNPVGTLHGGALLMIADVTTSIALGFFHPEGFASVSVDLTCQFVSSAKPGDSVDVRCVVTKAGRSMAFMRFEFTEPDRPDKVLASGVHTKFIFKPKM
ncbi:hypothetical protein HK105_206423 [Polyrhizophydium stewartii]|uniref:Thioesterase domain-containing protein n=1 Tax=Polyrhizophydium stewartii TaxID=2732419 RepID=A0ABR4N3C7_9FUNG